MAVKFTEAQQSVIDTRGKNILVSAAAGSGKTAVLVERIVQMITDSKNPVDIDRLLIVTFTSAAAAQMRERISAAVTRRLEAEPENEHLQRQSALIHNAQITTIDSFCLFIIRNNFNEIGLDPAFRVADEGEIKLLESDVMAKLLEDMYAEPTESFLNFVECYSTGSDEKRIEEAILRLYHFAVSYPFPEEWLRERLEDYKIDDAEGLSEKKWFQYMLSYMDTALCECEKQLNMALKIAGGVGGPAQYIENLESDLELIKGLKAGKSYPELYELFTYSSFTRLSAKKGEGVDADLKEAVKSIRDDVKKNIGDLKKNMFMISADDIVESMAACDKAVSELVLLTLEYKRRLDAAKRDMNIVDFPDMEHLALQILVEKDENGKITPRSTAIELQDYFAEIMIDEYQDSNEVQELLLKCISGEEKGRHNRFMVGDIKQSIYKFRLARPEIFMEKYDTYVTNADGCTRIDLSTNFRSRREVTDAVNFICGQLMRKQVGNVEYDDKAALHAGAEYPYPESNNSDSENIYQTELLIASASDDDSEGSKDGGRAYTEKEKEAMLVASRIKELVGSFPVTDAATGEMRPAKFSDIVLLFRATAGWDEDFRRILSERGIPVHVTSRTGYFETIEIQGIVNFLRVLDNPLQDIPFFGVMKLPYFGFSEEEIALISCYAQKHSENKKMFLYEQAKLCHEYLGENEAQIPELEGVDGKKLSKLFASIDKFRAMASYMPIKELIQELIRVMGYDMFVGALPGGGQRRANLELLLEKAGAFQKTSFYGLFHFIRYLETMQEQEVDFGEANILDENADVVRIMTIHKSKGLEFPICFVCGLSKQFNQMDMRQSIIMDAELGIGVDYIDPVMRVKSKTLRKNAVARKMKEDTRGEDMRVFYVALTRAKEKLILTGYIDDLEKKLSAYRYITMDGGQKLPYSAIMAANSYMDMTLMSLMRHECMDELVEGQGEEYSLPYDYVQIKIAVNNDTNNPVEQLKEQGEEAFLEACLDDARKYADAELSAFLEERLRYKYPHAHLEGLKVKTTVSELKRAAYEEADPQAQELIKMPKESYVPRFRLGIADEGEEERQAGGAYYGNAVHKNMELLSFEDGLAYDSGAADMENAEKRLYAVIKYERNLWISEGRVSQAELECVKIGRIIDFVKTPLAQRMIAANRAGVLFKEQPFVLGIPADRLNEHYPADETVLVQGVIDVFFYEAGGIVLADYKTDRVDSEEELIARYKAQLDYYQLALEQITGQRVKERYLYSFALKKEIFV